MAATGGKIVVANRRQKRNVAAALLAKISAMEKAAQAK
jgi:hypothetical protein